MKQRAPADRSIGNPDIAGEFNNNKLLILAAAVGLSTGMTATMFYSMGTFIPALQADMQWSRGDISLGVTIMTLGLFLAGPMVGRLSDRFGAATVGSISLIGYALAVIVLAGTVTSLTGFWIGYFLIAVLGAGSTPIGLIRPISARFDKRRGLALGIVLTGAGVAGFWVPNLTAAAIATAGWRAAYLALAATALLVAPLVWFGFRPVERTMAGAAAKDRSGLTAREARGTRHYWLLSVMALAMALGIAGIVVHLAPLFQDFGKDPLSAARLASLVGLSSVFGRIAVGMMLDRFVASLVSMAILALAMLGIMLLWVSGLAWAPVAVILLGLAAGAEIDLLAYLTARFFGQRAYGAIYGWQYSIFALGYGFSPFLVGRVRDMTGDYQWALIGSAALMGVAALAALALGDRKWSDGL